MYIAKVLSNLNAWNLVKERYTDSISVLEKVLEPIHPRRSELSKEGRNRGKFLFSAKDLWEQFSYQLFRSGWRKAKRQFGKKSGLGFSSIDAVKEKLGIEYLFGKFAFVESDIFVKFPIFIQAGVIDIAIIIMPMKVLSDQMVAGICSLEMVENRLDEIPALLPKYPFLVVGISHEPSTLEVRELYNPANQLNRSLQVFLCHSSGDKPQVRQLYKRLHAMKNIDPWLDEVKLLPGVQWDSEITKAVKESDVVIVCLSNSSINKEGYVQREIRRALDTAEEKLDDTIFIIPLRLEECKVPDRLGKWHWVNYYEDGAFDRLMSSLRIRAESIGIEVG